MEDGSLLFLQQNKKLLSLESSIRKYVSALTTALFFDIILTLSNIAKLQKICLHS